jgi:hypothetical protein
MKRYHHDAWKTCNDGESSGSYGDLKSAYFGELRSGGFDEDVPRSESLAVVAVFGTLSCSSLCCSLCVTRRDRP